jgi:hypothetical protein
MQTGLRYVIPSEGLGNLNCDAHLHIDYQGLGSILSGFNDRPVEKLSQFPSACV